MQFRISGNRIQLLRYEGYDREKRRAIVKMVGSTYRFNPVYDSKWDSILTVEEKEAVQSYIKDYHSQSKIKSDSTTIKYAHSRIDEIADCLLKEETDKSGLDLVATWEAIERLQKAMKQAGFPKPKRPKPQKKQDPRQESFIET